MDILRFYDSRELAEHLCNLTDIDVKIALNRKQTINELDMALYNLQAIAKNEFNSDYWRILYNALAELVDIQLD